MNKIIEKILPETLTQELILDRKKLLQEFILEEKKLIDRYKRQIEIIEENISILCSIKQDEIKNIEPFTGFFPENEYLQGLYVTNNLKEIVSELQVQRKIGLPDGFFINIDGIRIQLSMDIYQRDVWQIEQKFCNGGIVMKQGQETPNQKTYDCKKLGVFFENLKMQDDFEGIETYEMVDYIFSLIENGFFYVMQKKPSGELQYVIR